MIKTVKNYDALSKQYDKMLEERNSLIDDIDWQQKKIERLEDENKEMMGNIATNVKYVWKLEREKEEMKDLEWTKDLSYKRLERDYKAKYIIAKLHLKDVKDENVQLKQDLLRTEELQDEIIQLEKDFEGKDNLLSEFSQHIGNKPSSSTYKYFRAKLDGIGYWGA